MEDKGYTKIAFPIILFLLIGMALNGAVQPQEEVIKTQIHPECQTYWDDNDNDGDGGFLADSDCWAYPYADGDGESGTSTTGQSPPHQNYFDLTVDFVRGFIFAECGNTLVNCIGTNFVTEVQFYCWFDQNVIIQDFFTTFDKFFNVFQVFPDDGSIASYQAVCLAFPPSNQPSTMPSNGDQYSQPIPDNPSGDPFGGGGAK
mgnify:CR=1 FL=1